jgi:predicted ATP-dependent serine protease
VLGGGIVEGGVVLIGGDPGIGKSTLLLQALDALQRADKRRCTSPARKAARRWRCARAGWGWTIAR